MQNASPLATQGCLSLRVRAYVYGSHAATLVLVWLPSTFAFPEAQGRQSCIFLSDTQVVNFSSFLPIEHQNLRLEYRIQMLHEMPHAYDQHQS